MEAALFVTLSDSLAKFLLGVLPTFCFTDLEVLEPKGQVHRCKGRHRNHGTELALILPPSHLGVLVLLSQQAKKRVTVAASVINPHYQEEIGLIFHNGGEEEYVWNTGDPLGCL